MEKKRLTSILAGIASVVVLLVGMLVPATATATTVGDVWVHKITYDKPAPTADEITYLHSSIVAKENVTDPTADDGLLLIDDAFADKITSTYKTAADAATCPNRDVYVALTDSWLVIKIQNPGTEYRAEADREHRLRLQTAKTAGTGVCGLGGVVVTNHIGYRDYSPSTFGKNLTLGETWSYTEQIDSSDDRGDSTNTVQVTVAGATESVTVPAGTFTCYKVTRQYPGVNPNGLDNTVTEWWEVDTAAHFCHAPIKTVDNHNFRYSQTSELNSVAATLCPSPVVDNCPDDPLKTEPGRCGCGVPDTECGESVGDAACYNVVYDDGTNPPTNESRTYEGTGTETITFAELEALLSMTLDDLEALIIDADFVSPEEPFRTALVVVPAPADLIAMRDWRSTVSGALLQ